MGVGTQKSRLIEMVLLILKRTISIRQMKQMFKLMDKKIFTILRSKSFVYLELCYYHTG